MPHEPSCTPIPTQSLSCASCSSACSHTPALHMLQCGVYCTSRHCITNNAMWGSIAPVNTASWIMQCEVCCTSKHCITDNDFHSFRTLNPTPIPPQIMQAGVNHKLFPYHILHHTCTSSTCPVVPPAAREPLLLSPWRRQALQHTCTRHCIRWCNPCFRYLMHCYHCIMTAAAS